MISDTIMIAGIPDLSKGSHDWNDAERNKQFFLVFKKNPDGTMSFFPRSLRRDGWGNMDISIIRKKSAERLELSWNESFERLPAIATTRSERLQGLPAIFGILDDNETRSEKEILFWNNANHAIKAIASSKGLVFPGPNKNEKMSFLKQEFKWSVFTKILCEKTGKPLDVPEHKVNIF